MADLIEAYFEAAAKGKHRLNGRPKRASTLSEERRYFDRHIKPRLGARPVADLTRQEVQRLVDDIEGKAPGAARLTRNVIRQAYNFAIVHETADKNPAARTSVVKWKARERVLADDELRRVWAVCLDPDSATDLDLSPGVALALRLAMLTLQRGSEVCGLHAAEIDLAGKLWTIPGTRTKNHRTHVVPLSAAAVDAIKDAFELAVGRRADKPSGYAFPSPRDRKKPITRRALSRAMKRLGAAKGVDV
ncbi:MAG: tyrosine-type recombinase/integrase, partial [Bauldia sp.]